MSYYKVSFRYVNRQGKLVKDSFRIDARNITEAKSIVIKGEKPKLIAVDKITKF